YGSPREKRIPLKYIPNVRSCFAGPNRNSIDQNLPCARRNQGRDDIKDGALTRSGRPKKGGELSAIDAERNVANSLDGRVAKSKGFAQAVDRNARQFCVAGSVLFAFGQCAHAGEALRAMSMKPGAMISDIASGLMPVISRNHTFEPRSKLSGPMIPS